MIKNLLVSVLLVAGFSACSDTDKEPKGARVLA